jgi:hypothetical protein
MFRFRFFIVSGINQSNRPRNDHRHVVWRWKTKRKPVFCHKEGKWQKSRLSFLEVNVISFQIMSQLTTSSTSFGIIMLALSRNLCDGRPKKTRWLSRRIRSVKHDPLTIDWIGILCHHVHSCLSNSFLEAVRILRLKLTVSFAISHVWSPSAEHLDGCPSST